MIAAERDQGGGQDRAHRGLERADPQRPGQAGPGRGEAGRGLLQQGQDGLGLPGQRAPAGVSVTRRPVRRSSGTPAWRSSAASCWETADGV